MVHFVGQPTALLFHQADIFRIFTKGTKIKFHTRIFECKCLLYHARGLLKLLLIQSAINYSENNYILAGGEEAVSQCNARQFVIILSNYYSANGNFHYSYLDCMAIVISFTQFQYRKPLLLNTFNHNFLSSIKYGNLRWFQLTSIYIIRSV